MKDKIKKVFVGIGFTLTCTIFLFTTLFVLYMYKLSFKEVGIWAILTFILASASLSMVLCGYYIIGKNILKIREINKKKKELKDPDTTLFNSIDKMCEIREDIFTKIYRGNYEK